MMSRRSRTASSTSTLLSGFSRVRRALRSSVGLDAAALIVETHREADRLHCGPVESRDQLFEPAALPAALLRRGGLVGQEDGVDEPLVCKPMSAVVGDARPVAVDRNLDPRHVFVEGVLDAFTQERAERSTGVQSAPAVLRKLEPGLRHCPTT